MDQKDQTNQLEQGTNFAPRFDAAGLVTAVVTHIADGTVLMIGHMNRAAIDATLASGHVTFFSRSRQRLWVKGESSGHWLSLVDMRVDCDQDALWIRAVPAGPTCHTGAQSCFYRTVHADGTLTHDDVAG
jgi:phosphoribosyl-AMP cyclohydrolase